MPRFSLKLLLLSTSLIATGLLFFVAPFRFGIHTNNEQILMAALFWTSGPLVGAGIGILLPFKMPSIGAVFGALVGLFTTPIAAFFLASFLKR